MKIKNLNKFNTISNRKKFTTTVLAIFLIISVVFMDFSRVMVRSDNTDSFTFFYDDFTFLTTNSTDIWKSAYDIQNGKLVVEEGSYTWNVFSILGWNGYTDLILKAEILPYSTSLGSKIIVRNANTSEILYSAHPDTINNLELNLLSYIDSLSTHLRLEVYGAVKFDKIRVYTPNLFIYNLLLDDNVKSILTDEVGDLTLLENGQYAHFKDYSRSISFDPDSGVYSYFMETQDYYLPYYTDLSLVGQIGRMYDEFQADSSYNSSIHFTIFAKMRYGHSYEYEKLLDVTEYLDGRVTPFQIPLSYLKGKDISFTISIRGYTLLDSPLPLLGIPYLGITAQSETVVNGRELRAIDYATKDVYTQILPVKIDDQEELVLARDQSGTVASYLSFIGTNSSYFDCSGYVLSEYLYDPSNAPGDWKADDDGQSLTFDFSEDKKGTVILKEEKFLFTSGTLKAQLSLYEYGLATGLVFNYFEQDDFWAFAVQKVRDGDDLALIIHNYAIVDSIPLQSKLQNEISFTIVKNSYLGSYHFYVDNQLAFIRSISRNSLYLGFFYRLIENRKQSDFYPAQFYGLSHTGIGEFDATRMYLTVQNPMNKEAIIKIKEYYVDNALFVRERELASFLVPHTNGFETFLVPCSSPYYNSRFVLEMDSDVLIYFKEFGFLGYTPFGSSRPASFYYDIDPFILNDSSGKRTLDNEVILEDETEWVSYDMELQEGFIYINANTTYESNLELEVLIKPINGSEIDPYIPVGSIYFLEEDGKAYSHNLFIDNSVLSTYPSICDIYEVKISVLSSVSPKNPVYVNSISTKSVTDSVLGDDYSNLPSDVDGWREEWDIDNSNVIYLEQDNWYIDVGYSSLNGGPASSWFSNTSVSVIESPFYTSFNASDSLYERFLGDALDVSEYPFIEFKLRSSFLSEITFGIHTIHGSLNLTVQLTDYWFFYRFNIYQMAASKYLEIYPNTDPFALEELLIDKIFFYCDSGLFDLYALKIYSIADWEYIPSLDDSFFNTAHIEEEQETIFKLSEDSELTYSILEDSLIEQSGNWTYVLDFMLTDVVSKTVLLYLQDEYQNKFMDTIFVQDGQIYLEDFNDEVSSLGIEIQPYEWSTLSLYSFEYSTTHEFNYTVEINGLEGSSYYCPANSGDELILGITTTSSPLFLRELSWTVIKLHENFEQGMIAEHNVQELDTWVIDDNFSISNSYTTKINLGDGGTLSSSSSYLVLDEGIEISYYFSDLMFQSFQDFYFWIASEVFSLNTQVVINGEYSLSSSGIRHNTDYKIADDDIGEYLETLSIEPIQDISYIDSFVLWGNYSMTDYYTDFSDGQSVLDDWTSGETENIEVVNSGDLLYLPEDPYTSDGTICYFDNYFVDFSLMAEVNISYEFPHIKSGLVFHSPQKNAFEKDVFTGFMLYMSGSYSFVQDYWSLAFSLLKYINGSITSIGFVDVSSFLYGYTPKLTYSASVTSYMDFVEIEIFFQGQSLEKYVTTPISEGGYTGLYLHPGVDSVAHWSAISSFSVYHKYYHPVSEYNEYDTSDKANYFVAGKLHIDSGIFETDFLDLNQQQTLTFVWEIEHWNLDIFTGLEQGSSKYGFWFFEGDVFSYDDGVTTLLIEDWCTNNTFRTLYLTVVFGFGNGTFNMQLFSDKTYRPDIGDELYVSFDTSFTSPQFIIKYLTSNQADFIIDSVELGGIYPVDVEFDDGSETHAVRGSGYLADYYLQATSQGSLKIDSSTSDAWMSRDFYVLEGQNSTISFSYLSPRYHYEPYCITIYRNQEIYLNISISSYNFNKEEIVISVLNNQILETLYSFLVPYYKWINVEITLSPLLVIDSKISFTGENLFDSASITSYLESSSYYTMKIFKEETSEGDGLFYQYISVYNGAGFSSSFSNGDFDGWTFNNKDFFTFSHEVTIVPDTLTVNAEPLGGWIDFTVLIDDGVFQRTTRMRVDDFETLRPYLIYLPYGLDTTEIHKYTILVDGILTLYSLSFQQSMIINDWLVTKPIDSQNEEILDEFTQMGYLIEDFETDIFDNIDIVEDPEFYSGNVGYITGQQTLMLSDYIGGLCQNDLDVSLYYYWNGLGCDYPFQIQLKVIDPKDWLHPIRTVNAIIIPELSDNPGKLKFKQSMATSDTDYIQFTFDYVPNTWCYLYIDLALVIAYSGITTEDIRDYLGLWKSDTVESITFNQPTFSAEVYIDDIQVHNIYEQESEPSPFARAYVKTSSLNSGDEGVWVPESVNSRGFLDFSLISDDDTALATEQTAFTIECDQEADVLVHITTTHPFIFYQGQLIVYEGTLLGLHEYYFNLHLETGINRFHLRSMHKKFSGFPWQIRVNFMTPTSVRVVSSTYQARDLSTVFGIDSEYPIPDWLVSDRPVNYGEVDFIPYLKNYLYYLEDNADHYFATRALPYPGEQMNYTIHLDEYNRDITEWVGFSDFYNETGVMNYVDSNLNNTHIQSADKIIYYTNLHFLKELQSNTIKIQTCFDPSLLIEAIYYDGQYVYGRMGEIGYNDVSGDFTSYISVSSDNDFYTLSIPLDIPWDKFAFDHEWHNWEHPRFEDIPETDNVVDISNSINPLSSGVHRFSVVLRCPDSLDYIPMNIFDLQANLTYFDDSINVFNQITDSVSTKQSLSETSLQLQTDPDSRQIPSSGLQSGKQNYAGKEVLESQVLWDGTNYHTTRIVKIGVDQWGIHDDMNGDGYYDESDATGLATYMLVFDAGTRHEKTELIQHMIGPEGGGSSSQPNKLSPRYTMTTSLTDSILYDNSNIRLSYSPENVKQQSPIFLDLDFDTANLVSFNLDCKNNSVEDTSTNLLNEFFSLSSGKIQIRFSLTAPILLISDNQTISLMVNSINLDIDQIRIVFDKTTQNIEISYSDLRNSEMISLHLLSKIYTHTDPENIHKSIYKLGQQNGFSVYNYAKINMIATEEIPCPQHISLSVYEEISDAVKVAPGAKFSTLDAFQSIFRDIWLRNYELIFPIKMRSGKGDNTNTPHGNPELSRIEYLTIVFNAVVYEIFGDVLSILLGIINWLVRLFEDIVSAFQKLFDSIENFLAKAFAWIANAWKKLVNFLKIIGMAIVNFFKFIGKLVVQLVKGVVNLLAEISRILILFLFSILFGTNVGLYDSSEVLYSTGDAVFDNETTKNYPHVYKVDHVIDVAAGRTNLEGELTEEELAERAANSVFQGEADNIEPNRIKYILSDMGFEMNEKDIISFGPFKWICSAFEGGQWDHYFGLKKHLTLFGLKLFSENTFILICEIILGILPIAGLIQDVKDTILEPMKFFRIFAAIMIPLDITEIFGNVLGQVYGGLKDFCAGKGIGKILGGIKSFIKNVFNFVFNSLKIVLKTVLKVTKYAVILGLALLSIVTVVLLPKSAILIFGLGTLFALFIAFVSMLITGMKFLMKKIIKPLFKLALRGLSWTIDKVGSGIKKIFTSSAETTGKKKLLKRVCEKVGDLFSALFDKLKTLWKIGTWKPWKNARLPWCVACFSNFAKKHIHNIFDIIQNNDEMWGIIKNLDPSSWSAIKNGAISGFPEDILRKHSIEECARLIFPGKTVDELFGTAEQFDKISDRWFEAVGVFHKTYKSNLGSKMSKTILKENLKSIDGELSNKIDMLIKSTDDLNTLDEFLDDPKALTEFFLKDENLHLLGEFYFKQFNELRFPKLPDDVKLYVNEMTSGEANAYARVLLSRCGAEGMSNTNTAEPFMKAWAKLHAEVDELRKIWGIGQIAPDIDEILISGLKGRFASSTGFDDLIVSSIRKSEPDEMQKYILQVFEQKARQDNRRIFTYLQDGESLFADAVRVDINILTSDFLNNLVELGIDEKFAKKITRDLNSKYRLSASCTGLDFTRKIKSGNLCDALISTGMSADEVNRILEGAIKQNQILSLIQNGNAHKLVLVDGYWTAIDEVIQDINLKCFVDDLGEYVEIDFSRNAFTPTIVEFEGKKILTFPGFDVPLDDARKSKAYEKLNEIIYDALNELDDLSIDELSSMEIIGRINEAQSTIYQKLLQSEIFQELNVFESGQMLSCLETIGDTGDDISEFLTAYFEVLSVGQFHGYQHWNTPFSLEGIFKPLPLGTVDESVDGVWDIIKKRYFGNIQLKGKYEVDSLEDALQIFEADPTWGQKIIRDLQPPFKVPDGGLFRPPSGTKRGILFFDADTYSPIHIDNNGPVLGFLSDFDDFFKETASSDLDLFKCPVKIKPSKDRGLVIHLSTSNDIVEAWKRRLIELGVPSSTVNKLKPEFDFMRGDSERLKLLALIFIEFRNTWDEYSTWLTRKITGGALEMCTDHPEYLQRLRQVGSNFEYRTSAGEWIKVKLGIGLLTDNDLISTQTSRHMLLPNQNSLFAKLIDDIEASIMRLLLNTPEDRKLKSIWDYIIQNWYYL